MTDCSDKISASSFVAVSVQTRQLVATMCCSELSHSVSRPLNIATSVVMPDEKADCLINSAELGEKQIKELVEKRLNTNEVTFWEPLPHLKVETFVSLSKKKKIRTADEKILIVNADRDLFGRLLIAVNSQGVQLREVLSYELSTIPYSLAHVDGSMRKATKSVLLAELETCAGVTKTSSVREHSYSLPIRRNGHRANDESWWCSKCNCCNLDAAGKNQLASFFP